MALAHSPRIVTDGLVLYLDATNPKSYPGSGTIWTDLSGNGYGGSLSGSVSYSSSPSRFDTNAVDRLTRDYLTTSSQIVFNDLSSYTFDFIVKLRSSAQATFNSLTGRLATTPWISIYPVDTTGDSWNIRYRQSGGTYISTSNVNYNIQNNWANIVLSVDTSRNLNFYLNGILQETINPTTTLFYVDLIGGGYSASGNYYALQGSIASCKIYSKTLSEQEIQQNFNAIRGRFGL
jgi:hypothetical protein